MRILDNLSKAAVISIAIIIFALAFIVFFELTYQTIFVPISKIDFLEWITNFLNFKGG